MSLRTFSTARRLVSTARMIGRAEGLAGLYKVARQRAGRTLVGKRLAQHFHSFGTYRLPDGGEVRLYAGYREALKPLHFLAHATERGFDTYLRSHVDEYVIRGTLAAAWQFVDRVEHELSLPVSGLRVLEVGCGDGALSYALASRGAEVVGTDKNWSYIPSLHFVRSSLRASCVDVPTAPHRTVDELERAVQFVEADIETGKNLDGPFDLILSNSVLEHIPNLPEALRTMTALLDRNGIMVHCFNPFFSETGGHEFCTLDFPWGHVRLSPSEIEQYLEIYRGWEASQAMHQLLTAFNEPRKTIREIDTAAKEAGLVYRAGSARRLCWWNTDEDRETILRQCRRVYPNVEWQDLQADQVWRVYSRS